ncbi:Putative ATP-dependent RNA helicase DDX60 [Pteropus alecto]|uniref:Putative ATP-dependent RNA helicase DDX60 n=1 Tax=Pteropus alecto TaxID=9402 RepID=L5L2S8_PTEAL|nr:Putative ATP-dependent RNA helicase DDX60 [Pteropus alecto]
MENSDPSQNALKVSKKQQRKRIEKPSYRVRLVWYKERYNDLEKYVCSLKDNDFIIEHYHPCAALTVNHELEPEEFSCFKNKIVITRADAKKYEEELKKEIIRWIQLDPSKVNQLLKYLKPQNFDNLEIESQKMFPCFVEKLKEMDKLPAIFFSYNIHSVEILASRLLTNLISKQITHNDPNSERKKKNLTKKLRKARSSQKRNISTFLNSDSGARIQRIILLAAEIKEIKKNLKKYNEFSPDCTYTDSTVVDNQMSGRAGRRGEDLIGNVFFYGIPLPKIERFLKSNVPKLKGQFPLSISLVLRLMLLIAKADDKEDAKAKKILDALPKEFATVVEEHNNRIRENFGSFLLSISNLADMRKEYQLPLSEIDFSSKECEDSELVSHLMPGTESRTAVSPFACLSDITDQDLFDMDVVNDVKLRTIYVNVENVPFLSLVKCNRNGRKCPLNGYALNFYKTGSLSALTVDNG